MYSFYARLNGIPVVQVPLSEDFTIDGNAIAEKAEKAALIFIASPNNPTGNLQPEEELLKVLETGKPVLLDEAYAEFSGRSLWELVFEYPNLIVLRTFSKAFGLAGVRVGYMIADEEVVDALYRIKSPFSLSAITMAIAGALLRHYEVVERKVRMIVEERERVRKALGGIAHPSDANFLLIKADAYDFLLGRDIVVRKLSGRLEGHIRATIGRRWENDALIKALEEFRVEVGGL